MGGALTFGYHNAAVCVLTVVPVWVMVAGHVCGADCMLQWVRPACAMVAGHVCGVVSCVLAVVNATVVH